MAVDTTRFESLDDIPKVHLEYLAEHIEKHINNYAAIYILPEHLLPQKETHDAAMAMVRELIEYLKKGKVYKVFRDVEDWNLV